MGCCLGLKDVVTAITFVALGTSLPDAFASKAATINDDSADAAVGNVTGSNAVNVFLLEQPACAAVELQCVNRVHCVGQTRPTTVYRYVVKDTIEDAIYEYHRTHTASVEEDVKEAEINAAKLLSAHVLRKRQKVAVDSSSGSTDASDDAPASD